MDTTITARLGLDTAPFNTALQQASRNAQSTGTALKTGFATAEGGSERLLTSTHRTARSIANLTRDMAAGADATTLMAGGLEGLERALRLPLGALAGLAVGGILIDQIGKIREEYQKLRDQTQVALFPTLPAELTALDSLTERIKVLNELLKTNQTAQENIQKGGWAKFMQEGKDAAIGLADFFTPENIFKNLFLKPFPLPRLLAAVRGTMAGIPEERRADIEAEQKERARDYAAQEQKIREQGVNVAQKLAELAIQRAKTELDAARTVTEKQQKQLELEEAQLKLEQIRNAESQKFAAPTPGVAARPGSPQEQALVEAIPPSERRIVPFDFSAAGRARESELRSGVGAVDPKMISNSFDQSESGRALKSIQENTRATVNKLDNL